MPVPYYIAVMLHVVAAFVWVGGVLMIGAVALPAARNLPEEQQRPAISAIARRFRPIGWTALAVLLLTGLFMLWEWGARPANLIDLSFFEIDRNKPLGIKLLLVIAMIISSGLHDWWVGPRATELADEDPERAESWRRWAGILGIGTGVFVLGVVLIAIVVARPWMTL